MKCGRSTSIGDLRMKAGEFDKIMRRALQVHPEPTPVKKAAKRPAASKRKPK